MLQALWPFHFGYPACNECDCFPVLLCVVRTLGEAWAQLKKSLADEADVHIKFSSKVSPPAHLCVFNANS